MRRRGRVDDAQAAIVQALRDAGCSVRSVADVGGGFVDLVAGRRGRNYLLEVKTGERPCDRKLTPAERQFHASWRGQIAVVSTVEEALREVGVIQ